MYKNAGNEICNTHFKSKHVTQLHQLLQKWNISPVIKMTVIGLAMHRRPTDTLLVW